MNYTILKKLIEQLEKYEAESKGESLADFVLWLNKQIDKPEPKQMEQTGIPLDGLLLMHLSNLYKYVKHYAKKIFEETSLAGIDDFTFLLTLQTKQNLSKSELIQMHLLEISSGTEIIKRLLKEALIQETTSTQDKRKKVLQLTTKGVEMIIQLMPRMGILASLASANLDNESKINLIHTLKYLDDFHKDIYHQKNFKNLRLEDIVE